MHSAIEKRLNNKIGKLIIEKELIKEGDHILIGLSGGKDSWSLVHFLHAFQKKAPINYCLKVVTLDVLLSKYQKNKLKKGMRNYDSDYYIWENNITKIIEEKRNTGSSYCSFCARMRRAYLYHAAKELGCNKVALGHHLDDLLETLLMNMFYHGNFKGMPAILKAQNGIHELIRPMLYCSEEDIIALNKDYRFPIIHCGCTKRNKTDIKRKYIKKVLKKLEQNDPGLKKSLLTSLKNVTIDHIF